MDDALDTLADRFLTAILVQVPHLGWTSASLRAACTACNVPQGTAGLIYPNGALDALAHAAARADTQALAGFERGPRKVREAVFDALMARVAAELEYEEAFRRALGRLMLPDAFGLGPRLLWHTSDAVWRAVGDTALDENYYSKRAILAGVWAQVALTALSDGFDAASQVAAARIENVMAFERFKRQCRGPDMTAFFGALGAMRYRGGQP